MTGRFARRPFLLILFLTIEILIVFYFINDYRRHDNLYRKQMIQALDAGFREAAASYDHTTQMVFDDVVNTPEVLKLVASALDDKYKRDAYRNELHRIMLSSYEKQKTIGIRQLHFHLKDGASFLRMHAPEKYGDNLFRRTAVYQVNKEQNPVKGYEVGYFADGYRFLYPLFFNGRHVGSVEFGITAEGIINHLNQVYPAHYIFMINRAIVDKMTYADWKKRNYRESKLSDRFVIGLNEPEDEIDASINQKIKNKVGDRLARMVQFVEKETVNGKDHLIVFLPVKDVTGKPAAYFVQYLRDDYSGHHSRLAMIDIALFTMLLSGIFYSIDSIQSRRKSLEQKNIELEQVMTALQQYKLLSIYARDIILFIDRDGRIIEANEAAEKAYGFSRKELTALHIKDLRGGQTLHSVEEQMKLANEQGLLFETVHRRRDGSAFPVEVSSVGVDIGDRRVLLSILRDITARKQAEEKLRKSETLLKQTQEITRIGGWEYDVATQRIYWTDEVYNIYEVPDDYDPNNIKQAIQFYAPHERGILERAFWNAVENGTPYDLELQFISARGTHKWVRTTARSESASGKITKVIGNIMDITEHKIIEDALKTSEERYRTLFEGSPDAIFLADPETGEIVDANPSASRLLKRPLNEIVGMHQSQLHPPTVLESSKEKFREHVNKTSLKVEIHSIQHVVLCSDGTEVPVDILAQMVTIKGRRLLQGVFRDVSARKRAEEALRESEEIFRSFMEYSPIYVFFKDKDIRGIRLSRNYETMLGKPMEELLGKTMYDLFPSELAKSIIADDTRIMKEGKTISVEEEFNGRVYFTIKFPIHIDGKPRYLAGYTIDITERKKAEEEIQKALLEKETLLKEIHHRVKNNMQVISSLLNLQARKIDDPRLRKPFEESQQRIKAMGLVHEKLYQSKDLTGINFVDYINTIVRELMSSYKIEGGRVTVNINAPDIVLDIDTAIPCGLIINELITNSLKYAFPEGESGEIAINFTRTDNTYNLTVKDSGIGLPEGFDYMQANTLGLQIVNVLIKQLGGTMQIRSDGGTEAVITFTTKEVSGGKENSDS